ncbi:hypothetical protein HYDPIDRAFT_28662 [Hydnomerulius pinastri MD-312]|uniref:Uncharacterized protein n=1 Tax=Hydnomerulius pinastri MD-312 TaxID=994086 RepID=A0A0C9W0F5_9AGAM|nr:hypothetical protein HYDPIDRAFT_28662 [Hydnomerulius pinastri MD-312]
MATPIYPPSPLLVTRGNSSRSTFSTDTELDDTPYASSSGTTTPEDDDQTFQLGQMLRSILDDKPGTQQAGRRGKMSIETKPRTFTLAITRVKKVARSLAMFKKKVRGIYVTYRQHPSQPQRPEDMSPILISSPLRERFGKRMSLRTHPDESFYSLPNRRLSMQNVSSVNQSDQHAQITSRKFGTVSGTSSTFIKSAFRQQQSSGFSISNFSSIPQATVLSSNPPTPAVEKKVTLEAKDTSYKLGGLVPHLLRILLFVPWCAAVGGALLLFPNQLELVTFRPGYLPSPKGLRRFAHWADCAHQHVMIFFACIAILLWYDKVIGLSFTGALLSRFVYVWSYFSLDRNIPLGEDDQQSVYLLATDLAFAEDSVVVGGLSGENTIIRVHAEEDT